MSRISTVLHVDTISIEGGLFTSEWLAKVSAQQAAMQADADYGVRAGFNLREEIGFAWRSAQTLWRQFDQARQQPSADAWGISQHFSTELLRQCFAFSLTKQTTPIVIAERNYPVQFSALEGHVPIVISPHDEVKALDVAHDRLGDNSGERIRKRSAFGLLQESLNAKPDALWGVATNGLQLRIARDNASLTRPAWVEVDLERLFTEERYADFSVMWLLLHASRFGSPGSNSTDCALEQWRNACREQGTRARETLRGGVEAALLELGQGFVSHPANTGLREALATGTLSSHEYLRELLRLVYRQIFLLTVEEREILHRSDADPGAVALYADGYSLRRLRERAVRRSAHDRHGDLWQALKQVWIGLGVGEPLLALPPLGGLFESIQCPHLDGCKLENRFLLSALFHLAWLRPEANAPLTRVNWRDMGSEELGSIYESLLELVPMLSNEHRQFGFHSGAATRGNARRTSGSYYTHDSLVQVQLDSALEPVIVQTLEKHPYGKEAVDALLEISVIDPACGSGHFLLAAARRIASHLARVRAQMRDSLAGNSGQPTPEDYRHALRDAVTHCVYGVDLNPMALELARMALWLEGYTPDAPLGFIDHHFQLGNGLLGVMDPKMILDGLPDSAYTELTGDSVDLCRDLKRRNRIERTGLQRMRIAADFSQSLQSMDLTATALPLQQLDELPDDTLTGIAAKRKAYELLQAGVGTEGLSLALNLYCAAYLLPKHGTATDTDVPTTQDVMNALLGQNVEERKKTAAINLAKKIPLLHWRLVFAQVFARGGFTVILANPPWERMKLQEEEYFSERAPLVAEARNKAERERAIRALSVSATGSPERKIYEDFVAAKQIAEAGSVFCHGTRYPLTGAGDVNTYALFAETSLQLLHPNGRSGLIIPSGIATDESTSAFFRFIIESQSLASFYEFENYGFFPGAGQRHMLRFALMTTGGSSLKFNNSTFIFQARKISDLNDKRRVLTLSKVDIARFNPITQTCPVFKTEKDKAICEKIYEASVPVGQATTDSNQIECWNVKLRSMFHMSNDSSLFETNSAEDTVPLFEAKQFQIYDHRWATFDKLQDTFRDCESFEKINTNYKINSRYWISTQAVLEKNRSQQKWTLAFRSINNSANARFFVISALPFGGIGNSASVISSDLSVKWNVILYGMIASLTFEFVVRQKASGTNLNFFIVEQLPLLKRNTFNEKAIDAIVKRVLELTFTSIDMKDFYDDVVAENPDWDVRTGPQRGIPWQWDPNRRAVLQAELDAIFARLYGLSKDDVRYILDPKAVMGEDYPSETFRVLKDKEIRQLGEYQTQRLVLEAWDKLEQGQL
jgi:hypothetical protein